MKLRMFLAILLFFSFPMLGMQTQYHDIHPENSWIRVVMNEGKSIHIPAGNTEPHTVWTDALKGCVATIISLEHANGDHTLALCHFAHWAKEKNKNYLITFLGSLKDIKKISCIIVPPGIHKNEQLVPIIDEEWKQMIIEILQSKTSSISVEMNPYFFNTASSAVKYTFEHKKATGVIYNKTREMDTQFQQLLLESHNQEQEISCSELVPLAVIAAFVGIFLYQAI